MSNAIAVENHHRTLVIRFTRPEIRSPLSRAVLSAILENLEDVRSRDDIDRLVFTGVDDVFASGADLREIAAVRGEDAAEFATFGQSLMRAIEDLSVVTIAAINGFCFGGALDLALACDRRIASASAQFAHPGADLGIMTGWGGTQRLPRLIGQARALEMFFTARRASAAEALRMGLVDRIVEHPLRSAIEETT